MNKIKIIIGFAVFSLINTGCSKDNKALTIEDMVVKNNEITGWQYSGAGWVANNSSELNEAINGGYTTYANAGFVEGINKLYNGSISDIAREISLTVYNQGDSINAVTVYEDPAIGMSGALPWTGENIAGTAAKYKRNSGLSQVLCFISHKYYVNLSINCDTEESLSVLQSFALNVDAKIKQVIK